MNSSKQRDRPFNCIYKSDSRCVRFVFVLLLLFMSRILVAIPHFIIFRHSVQLVARVQKITRIYRPLCHNLLNLLCLNVDNFPNINTIRCFFGGWLLNASPLEMQSVIYARENHVIHKINIVRMECFLLVCRLIVYSQNVWLVAACYCLLWQFCLYLQFCFLCLDFSLFLSFWNSNSFSPIDSFFRFNSFDIRTWMPQ